jgi:hypothetical protein
MRVPARLGRSGVFAPRLAAWDRDLVEWGGVQLGELGIAARRDRRERLGRHQPRPREALGVLLVADRAVGLAGVDRGPGAQRGDEARPGIVGLAGLDVRMEVSALGGDRGEATAVVDETHVRIGAVAVDLARGRRAGGLRLRADTP